MTSGNGLVSSDGDTKPKGDDDDALMDYAPGKVLGTEELSSIRGAVTTKLSEVLGEPCDEVFPEYVTVMVSNGKTIREISTQLEDLLTAKMATVFSKWLGNHLRGLESQVKSTSASSGSGGSAKDSSKGSTKEKGNGSVSRGANGRSSRGSVTAASKGGEGVMASEDAGGGGRVGALGSKGKTSGSKVSRTAGGVRGRGSREWSVSQSRERDSWDSDRDERRGRSRDRSKDRSRDSSRDRFRRHSRDGSRDMSGDRGRERLRDRLRERSYSRGRSRDHSRDLAWDRSRDGVRNGRNRPRVKSRDSRDRDRDGTRHYGSVAFGRDHSRDDNAASRDRYRNGGSNNDGGGGNTSGGRGNGYWDRNRDGARDSFSRGGERGGERREGRHNSGSHVVPTAPRTRGDHDRGRRARERSAERSTERPVSSREDLGTAVDHSTGRSTMDRSIAEPPASESSKEYFSRARGEERGKNGDRKKERKSKGGTKDKVREKKKVKAAEREERRDGQGGDQEPVEPVRSTVVVSPPAKIEDPKAVSVVASVAVVGDGVKKEELDAANERAKLPDLRTVIERSRRRPNPAQQDKRLGDKDDDMGNMGDEREETDVEKRPVLVKGRMAGVQGGMRGFSPEESPSNGREAGVKRDFVEDVPSSRQRAFAASGGGRLLSTAVMQSVQSALSSGPVAGANGYSGEKRRKSDKDRGSGNGDAPRYVMTSGNRVGRTVEPDQGAEEIAGAPFEEDTSLHAPGRLRASAPEFQPSHGVSRTIPANTSTSASATSSGAMTPMNRQNSDNDESSSIWPPTTSGDGEEQNSSSPDLGAGHSSGGQSSNVWGRLGPRVNDGNGQATSLLPAEREFLNTRQPAGRTQSWAEWAQTIGSVPGSPSDAAAKWAAALRVAAGAATAAAASTNSNSNSGTPLARRGSEDLTFMASYDGAAQAEESSQLALAGWGEGGTSGSLGGGRGVSFVGRGGRGVAGGRFGRGGGRNFTWVREGLRGGGRGTGAAAGGVGRGAATGTGGRGYRGAWTGRGRPVVAKSLLGRGGGWHSTKSVVGRGPAITGAAAVSDQVAAVAGRGAEGGGWERETWNKVWVRKELRTAEDNGENGAGTAQQANENS